MIVAMKRTKDTVPEPSTLGSASLNILQLVVRYLFWITLFLFSLWMILQYTESDLEYVAWIGSVCTYTGICYMLLSLGTVTLRTVILVREGGVPLLPFIYTAVGILITAGEILLIQLIYAL